MKELIEYVAKSLVDKPERRGLGAKHGRQPDGLGTPRFKEDYGKVIGKQGRTIKALRTLVSAVLREKWTEIFPRSR